VNKSKERGCIGGLDAFFKFETFFQRRLDYVAGVFSNTGKVIYCIPCFD
jgi:hypothetical protein